jgi:hypothetical protein
MQDYPRFGPIRQQCKTNIDNIEVLERGNEQGFKSETKMTLKVELMEQEYT